MNTLDVLSNWFLTATIRASLLALAVLALQMALRKHLPARWRFALWLPVILVLVAPELPDSRWSLENYVAPKVVTVTTPGLVTALSNAAAEPTDAGALSSPVKSAGPDGRRIAAAAWLAGAGLVLLAGLISYLRMMRRMRQGEVAAGPQLSELLAGTSLECGLRKAPRMLVSNTVPSPAVTGLFRPLLILPADVANQFTPEELRLILLHELTHLRRHDLALNWLLCLLQALHWCNPLLWFAFARMRADREAACDEQVLATTQGRERAEYGHVLLKLASAARPSGFTLGFVGIFGPVAAIRARIMRIATYRREHAAWRIVGIVLIAVLALAGATRAQPVTAVSAKDGQKQQIQIEAKFILAATRGLRIDIEAARINALGDQTFVVQSVEQLKNWVTQLTGESGGKLLSSPQVVTLDGQSAKIQVGEEAPSNPGKGAEKRFVGFILEVTPHVEGGRIELDLSTTFNAATDSKTGKPVSSPIKDWSQVIITERKVSGGAKVAPGQGLSIIQTSSANGADEETLIIAVSPKLVDGAGQGPREPGAAPVKAAPAKPEAPKKGGAAERKAAAIKIPSLKLQNLTLQEIADLLNAQLPGLDPEKKGVTIVLAPQVGADARITLSLSEIPLLEALKYITNLSETRFSFDGDRIIISPAPLPPK